MNDRNNTRLFKSLFSDGCYTLASSQAWWHVGFQLNAQSAASIGDAFAGDAVIANNASVMARNPRNGTVWQNWAFSWFEASLLWLKLRMLLTRLLGGNSSNADYDDAGDTSIAPNIHLIVPVNDKFAWGVNAYSNFGTKTEFSDSYV